MLEYGVALYPDLILDLSVSQIRPQKLILVKQLDRTIKYQSLPMAINRALLVIVAQQNVLQIRSTPLEALEM